MSEALPAHSRGGTCGALGSPLLPATTIRLVREETS